MGTLCRLALSDVLIGLQPLRAEHHHGLVYRSPENLHPDMCFRCTRAFVYIKGSARNLHGLSHDGRTAREGNLASHTAPQMGHTSIYPSGSMTLPMRGVHCIVSTSKQLVGRHFARFPRISNTPKLTLYPSFVLFMSAT